MSPCGAEGPRWKNPWHIAGDVAAIFSPQREVLKLDGHAYSPTILHRMLHMAGIVSSFDVAQVALAVVGEISVSDCQINELAVEVGRQL